MLPNGTRRRARPFARLWNATRRAVRIGGRANVQKFFFNTDNGHGHAPRAARSHATPHGREKRPTTGANAAAGLLHGKRETRAPRATEHGATGRDGNGRKERGYLVKGTRPDTLLREHGTPRTRPWTRTATAHTGRAPPPLSATREHHAPRHERRRTGNATHNAATGRTTATNGRNGQRYGRTRSRPRNATERATNATNGPRRRTRPTKGRATRTGHERHNGTRNAAGRAAPPWAKGTHNGRANAAMIRGRTHGTTPRAAVGSGTGRDNGTNLFLGRPAGGVPTRE